MVNHNFPVLSTNTVTHSCVTCNSNLEVQNKQTFHHFISNFYT